MPLVLSSLEVQGFRAFRRLVITRLGRVNLIVGKNNTGKSSVLEALRLYATGGNPQTIFELLEHRGEVASRPPRKPNHAHLMAEHLFYGRQALSHISAPIWIAQRPHDPEHLTITFDRYIEDYDPDTPSLFASDPTLTKSQIADLVGASAGLRIQVGSATRYLLPFNEDGYLDRRSYFLRGKTHPPAVAVSPSGLSAGGTGQLWDQIALTDLEAELLASLRLIEPGVERLSFVGDQDRSPVVRLLGSDRPVPLSSMGDGMTRMLHLVLALVNARDGMLLIDEVENGIHYSVQPDLWRLVFQVARRLNVQVFATSHSLDCVQAFQRAAEEDEAEEGILIRLQHRKGEIEAVPFDEDKLGFATREQIEVRG